ncbi:hypothetical protein SS50377_22174 [Spironucleus salmonicida]|uniref:Uncharacterized protein n=1 Tax=Spironucleus salmonicida TaxID=348837 RepID=V6LLZ6_9EUKA|nr:hypothetical protein SS50377_22174 [Spironucleus salmonicida]|eukprot:EST45665.1 Hypothetical protein SS50377_14237 [Spironucleus salmonicida]
MADQVERTLQDYCTQLNEYYQTFHSVDKTQQQMIAKKVEQISVSFNEQNDTFINVLSENTIDDAKVNEISNLYSQVTDLIKKFPRVDSSHSFAASPNSSLLAPPRVSTQSATKLNDNIKSLRSQLQNIHKLLNSAQDATEVSYEEKQDQQQSRDISVMAVNQLKATTKVQNEQLRAEVTNLRQQVDELLRENNELKQKYTDASHSLDQIQDENQIMKKNQDQFVNDRKERSETVQQLVEERDKYLARYQNIDQKLEMEMDRARQERESRYFQVTELESENTAMKAQIQKLKVRLEELESCDVETAAIEVQRAAKTVEQLNSVITELKTKLVETKKSHNDHVQQLRTTIAVLSEEIYGDDQTDGEERVPREELEKKIAALMQQNEQLQNTVQDFQSRSQNMSQQAPVQQPGLQLSSMVPVYANPESMLQSISLYQGKKMDAPRKEQSVAKKDDDDVIAIINQRRK